MGHVVLGITCLAFCTGKQKEMPAVSNVQTPGFSINLQEQLRKGSSFTFCSVFIVFTAHSQTFYIHWGFLV